MSQTPPVSKDGFYYAGDSLYVEATGHNRHRRATLPELRALFHPTSTTDAPKDPVGHWYEAQLLHYGLRPSKTKGVAKSRLLDAFNKGNLSVPVHIQKVEAELKKKWTKEDKETRAKLKKEQESKSTKRLKRKAPANSGNDDKKDMTISVDANTGGKKVGASASKAKSAVATKIQKTSSDSAVDTSATDPRNPKRRKQTARRGSSAVGAKKMPANSKTKTATKTTAAAAASAAAASAPPEYSTKQTARGGPLTMRRAALRGGRGGARAVADSSSEAPRRMLARRGGGSFTCRGSSSIKDESDDEETEEEESGSDNETDSSGSGGNGGGGVEASGEKLGLLNGTYEVECDSLRDWAEYDDEDFTLILTLQGQRIWGAYDFGMFSGIILLAQRPYEASNAQLEFQWRGEEHGEGQISCDAHQKGWIKFLGNGRIEGMISVYGNARFTGRRISGSQTRSDRDAASMRAEWDGYNQDEYDRRNRARWRGSGW